MLLTAIISALVNVVLLGGLPFLGYFIYHRWRHGRRLAEVAHRAGLQIGKVRYLGYGAAFAAITAGAVLLWPPSVEASTREGSAFREFAGLGLNGTTILMALLYGVVKTGFAEEFLFRGLIAGSLSRRLSLLWANIVQALIFLAPHALLLLISPELWTILPVVFVGALVGGWLRIRSGSILAPWLIHATANVTVALTVAVGS